LKTVEWKPVVYDDVKPGMYEVSNYGFIRNAHTRQIMSICFSEKGYAMVELATISGKGKSKKLHRIVAKHFVDGETESKCEVDHLDGNKRNNQASNLEWVTHLENIRRAYNIILYRLNIVRIIQTQSLEMKKYMKFVKLLLNITVIVERS